MIDSAIFVSSRVRVFELGKKKRKLPRSLARGSRSGFAHSLAYLVMKGKQNLDYWVINFVLYWF